MSTAPSVKVLAVGSALGSISNLLSKVKNINTKHGPFELLLCTGDFFGPDEGGTDVDILLEGKLEFPIPTYIMQGEHALPPKVISKASSSNGQLCPNVFFLGKSNLLVTSQGLRIGIFGGKYDPSVFEAALPPDANPSSLPTFNSDALKTFLANPLLPQAPANSKGKQPATMASSKSALNQYVDIIMSHEWPIGIAQQCPTPLPDPEAASWGAAPLQQIARLRPRYHFASGGGPRSVFWERPPYVWSEDARVTRFVSLGAFGGPEPEAGKKKERWFYAFSISPQTEGVISQPRPANATPSPFDYKPGTKRDINSADTGENFIWGHDAKRPRTEGQKPPPGYVCKICQSTEHYIGECPRKGAPKVPAAGYTCKICDSPEHFMKDCPRRNDAENKPPESYVCKVCNKPGHFVRHCPERHATGDTGGRKPPPGYICRACGSENHLIADCPSKAARGGSGKREPRKEIGPDECWFCLSNPRVTKHLIISIGGECYITAPKGQLPAPSTSSGVPGGGHVLIIPISHYPTLQSVPSELSIPIVSEIEKYKSALRQLYAKHDCVAVAFEVARLSGKGGHAHVQVIPVPRALEDKVEGQFKQDGKTMGVNWEEDDGDDALERAVAAGENYFRVDLPDGRKMVHLMKPGGRPFNLQFGRIVLANVMGLQDRIDWKVCTPPEAEEKKDASLLKAAFAPFEPPSAS